MIPAAKAHIRQAYVIADQLEPLLPDNAIRLKSDVLAHYDDSGIFFLQFWERALGPLRLGKVAW